MENEKKLLTELIDKRDSLITRLDTGASRIEEARARGENVSSWEDFWIILLHQYTNICDRIRDVQIQILLKEKEDLENGRASNNEQ
jgi:hypothetical protein